MKRKKRKSRKQEKALTEAQLAFFEQHVRESNKPLWRRNPFTAFSCLFAGLSCLFAGIALSLGGQQAEIQEPGSSEAIGATMSDVDIQQQKDNKLFNPHNLLLLTPIWYKPEYKVENLLYTIEVLGNEYYNEAEKLELVRKLEDLKSTSVPSKEHVIQICKLLDEWKPKSNEDQNQA